MSDYDTLLYMSMRKLNEYNKNPEDVLWVGEIEGTGLVDWDDFEQMAERFEPGAERQERINDARYSDGFEWSDYPEVDDVYCMFVGENWTITHLGDGSLVCLDEAAPIQGRKYPTQLLLPGNDGETYYVDGYTTVTQNYSIDIVEKTNRVRYTIQNKMKKLEKLRKKLVNLEKLCCLARGQSLDRSSATGAVL